MKIGTLLTSAVIAGFLATSALAQTAPAPAAPTAPAATTAPAKAKTKAPQSPTSQACSAQADAKGLHGKERQKFRSACKKNGGKAG
ncbi:PsiF family protein [Labrys neptuniae]